MKHQAVEKLIQKRLDQEITSDEEAYLFQHLKECAKCQAYYLEMERIKNGVAGLIEFFPRVDFNTRVLVKIGIRRSKIWSRVVPAFAGLYLAGLLILLFSPLLNLLLSKVLLSLPGIFKVFDKIRPFGNSIWLLTSSCIKHNTTQVSIGFLFSLLLFYICSRAVETFRRNGWQYNKI